MAFFDHEARTMDAAACNDILQNQFCLLPKRNTAKHIGTRIDRVDNVMVWGSPVLESYRLDPFATLYIAEIKDAYAACIDLDDASFRAAILERVIGPLSQHPSFHHVLTELAFLDGAVEDEPGNGAAANGGQKPAGKPIPEVIDLT
ncbi:uncharacterized protein B0I36DRAFT_369562 [Microdochium trichocladiopsis]|uniref:Uncharacterized protein n=1 Tax=Microdochium trichocladiopsis TaxID=1682393 RepID=A0A9P9BIR9_9PEZI|nr:uncharacterized protein B0I36DRAFT_369562 [Microdochium trichocladiopsis]KAH7014625.1 hypothetical protein B0I36DRAFT_369562 [Microdochium trichocladiopsis]